MSLIHSRHWSFSISPVNIRKHVFWAGGVERNQWHEIDETPSKTFISSLEITK